MWDDRTKTFLEFSDNHWRIRQLRATFMHCVRHHCPLVIHGPPGSGRTSMTAAVSQFCRGWLSSPHAVVAARVLASSPASMTIEYVLSTICCQIAEVRSTETVSRTVTVSDSVCIQSSNICTNCFNCRLC